MTYLAIRACALVSAAAFLCAWAAAPAQAASLTSDQASQLVSLLQSFGFDGTAIAKVEADLGYGAAASAVPACPSAAITHNLSVGATDAASAGDVSRLQTFLGISPTGYFGPITRKGVIAWQSSNAVSPTGYAGPATRAAIASRCNPAGSTHPDVSFSGAPSVGSAPLAVSFTGTGTGLGTGTYIIDYGDGATSGPIPSYCSSDASGTASAACSFSAGHTYTSAGIYTVSLSPYIACQWSTPRCDIATQLFGTATVTVGNAIAAGSLVIPGSSTLSPGESVRDTGPYFTYTLTLNTVSLPSSAGTQDVSANFTWAESHCGTSGCLGAADPAAQTFTLYLSGGPSSYTTALGHAMTLTAVGANSATLEVSK